MMQRTLSPRVSRVRVGRSGVRGPAFGARSAVHKAKRAPRHGALWSWVRDAESRGQMRRRAVRPVSDIPPTHPTPLPEINAVAPPPAPMAHRTACLFRVRCGSCHGSLASNWMEGVRVIDSAWVAHAPTVSIVWMGCT